MARPPASSRDCAGSWGPACFCCSSSATSSAPASMRSSATRLPKLVGQRGFPFLVAFVIAAITALSYLELVTKYPQAAGAALYAQKAFNRPFVTFVVAFVVMCAGITSASTAARFFAANFFIAFQFSWGTTGSVVIAVVFTGWHASASCRRCWAP